MSDFIRIMRGWIEFCKTQKQCARCRFYDMCRHSRDQQTVEMCVNLEAFVENWLKDHPLPSTPTWIKWLSENGIVDSTEDDNVKLLPLAYYPMDEEIAKKLGELKNG